MKNNLLTTCSLIALVGIIFPFAAHADTIDYGSLQELFGEPVTTSATGTPQKASEVAANMAIITADEIRQSGSRSIAEVISLRVPGMDLLQGSYAGYDLGVRGYQQAFQPRLLVLVDGRQVFFDDYSRTVWNNIPVNIDDIRQIEVVKGASSALFGSNAAGGVVNIVTYSPVYDNSNIASVSVGSQNSIEGEGTATIKGGWGGSKFTVGGLNADEFNTKRTSTEQSFSEKPSRRYFSNSSVFKADPKVNVNSEFTYSENKQNDIQLGGSLENAVYTTYSARVGFDWQSNIGLIKNNNYINHLHVSDQSPTISQVGLQTDLIVSQFEDQFRVGKDNTFRAAVEFRHKAFKVDVPNQVAPAAPETDSNVYAASGTWLWQINDNLAWTNAARLDHVTASQKGTLSTISVNNGAEYDTLNAFSANSGMSYKLSDKDTLRATFGRGVQLPSMIEYGFDTTANQIFFVYDLQGNTKIKPTVVHNYELGYDRKISEISSVVKLSGYFEQNYDLKAYQQPGTRFIGFVPYVGLQNQNIGDSQGFGGEIELKGSSQNGFHWDASYSWSQVADSQIVSSAIGYDKSAPTNHFRLLGGYASGKWEFDGNSQLTTQTSMVQGANRVVTNGYFSLGGRMAYMLRDNVTLALSGTNLSSDHIDTSAYPAVERKVIATVTAKF